MTHPSDDTSRPAPGPEGGSGRPAADRPVGEETASPADRRTTPAADKKATDRPTTDHPAQEPRGKTAPAPVEDTGRGGRTAGIWIALILGAIVLILLLIFILQNNVSAQFHYFGGQFDLPLGIAMLLAAIAGALVMALVGSVRMIQMAWMMRKMRKDLHAIRERVGR